MTVTTEMELRYRDLDPVGGFSDVVIATYLEQARDAYLEAVVGDMLRDYPRVVASLEIDLAEPVRPDETIEIAVEAAELGTSSAEIDHEVTTGGERVATARATVVFLEERGGRPTPMPDELRERIEATGDL